MMADIDATKRLMGALMRMKPKSHEDMKIGTAKTKTAKKLAKKRASSRPKNA